MATTYLYDLPNNTTNMDTILVDTITVLPAFTPILLFVVFCIVSIGGISRQKLKTGRSDSVLWLTIASVSTLIIALIMSTITGIIRLDYLVIIVSMTILFGVWLFLDRKSSEI